VQSAHLTTLESNVWRPFRSIAAQIIAAAGLNQENRAKLMIWLSLEFLHKTKTIASGDIKKVSKVAHAVN
jgi:copper homeostasis protein CutC